MKYSRVRIDVTPEDIAWSEKHGRGDSSRCMVRTAVKRIFDGKRVIVDNQHIRLTTVEGERLLYDTPTAVQSYLVAFDDGIPIEPFSFFIRDPRRLKRNIRTEAGKRADSIRRQKTRPKKGKSAETKETQADLKEAVLAPYKDAVEVEKMREADGKFPKAPRVSRTNKRVFGQKVMRVNRPTED